MKKTLLILFILLLFLTGCDKGGKDPDPVGPEDTLRKIGDEV